MDELVPTPGAKFRWRTCTINLYKVAECYGPIDAQGDTVEYVYRALTELDDRLFADDFGPASVAKLSAEQLREWMHCVLRAWAVAVTEYLPETTNNSRAIASETRKKNLQAEVERQKEIVERNKPRFQRAWDALRELKVCSVQGLFSGADDSGEIELTQPGFEEKSRTSGQAIADMVARFRSIEVLVPGEAAPVRLQDMIKELSNDLLCRPEVPDWIDNEDLWGKLEWRVSPDGSNALAVTVHQRVTRYDKTVLTYDGLGEMIAMNHQGRSN
jgi:hypothetical protein